MTRSACDEWLSDGDLSIVVGEPRAGKSSLLRFVVSDLLDGGPRSAALAAKFGSHLPVWLPFSFLCEYLKGDAERSVESAARGETAGACGAYVLVRAAGGKSITVRITNECPLPCAPGQLDLSQQAFAKLADLKVGRIPITWQLLSPSTSDTISIRYKTGSSPHWCGIQAIGHRNPVARLEVRTSGGWRQLPRTEYSYFISADGSGCSNSIRVTDIYGEQLTITGIALRPNVVQPTGVQFARH